MFLQKYVEKFDINNFAENLSLKTFEEYSGNLRDINSNSALRKIYDSYLKILNKNDFEIEKEILFAKIAYQEQRGLLPKNGYDTRQKRKVYNSFIEFLENIYKKINDKNKFKKFLEVLVAYHKFFNPNAK